MKGKIKVKCNRCRQFKWVPTDVYQVKMVRLQKKTKRANVGYKCCGCI